MFLINKKKINIIFSLPWTSSKEREGVCLSTCFFPLLMAIHGNLLLEAWMDPGNPDNPGKWPADATINIVLNDQGDIS